MMKLLKNEKGEATIVEATLLLPFCILVVMALFLVALFMCQKANLQANLQTALTYYKNPVTDTYVELSTDSNGNYRMNQTHQGTEINGNGSYYPTSHNDYKFMYRNLFSKFDTKDFAQYFSDICGFMFFTDYDSNADYGSSTAKQAVESGTPGSMYVEMSKPKNYVVFKEWNVTVTQVCKPAIHLSFLGYEIIKPWTIVVSDKVVVNNGDDVIRDVDFVYDIVSNTAFGEKIGEVSDKIKGAYDKFYNFFHSSQSTSN